MGLNPVNPEIPPNQDSDLHINKPFEVCLLPVLLSRCNRETKEKVGGKQRIDSEKSEVLKTNAGLKPQTNERNYW